MSSLAARAALRAAGRRALRRGTISLRPCRAAARCPHLSRYRPAACRARLRHSRTRRLLYRRILSDALRRAALPALRQCAALSAAVSQQRHAVARAVSARGADAELFHPFAAARGIYAAASGLRAAARAAHHAARRAACFRRGNGTRTVGTH